jgi:NADH dehydrogenase
MGHKKHLVVIGAGFGGLNLIKNIDKSLWDVTIIDQNNYHSFPPLFYQIASAGLEPSSISFPLRRELRRGAARDCRFVLGLVQKIDTSNKCVYTQYETINYDSLVIAAGTTNNFFGIPKLIEKVYTIKSTSEAIRTRNAILERFERAISCKDEEQRRTLLAFTVVGGGPTGVEIAGALGEMKCYIVPREYPSLDPDEVQVTLVEGSDRLLRTMSEESSADALIALTELKVDVQLNKLMKCYDGHELWFEDGDSITTESVIWTAGITGVSFELIGTDVKPGPGNRFVVDEYNRIIGLNNVFAIGDIALHTNERFQRGAPQLAQVAIQQAQTLAENLNHGQFFKPFDYKDKGSMATIGRNRAVVDIKKVHLKGWLAWITWMFVHLITLLGMRNKAVVFVNWMWGYFSYTTSLRLILRPSPYPLRHDRFTTNRT